MQHSQWMRKLADRIGMNKASVAVANKNARVIISLLKNQEVFKPHWLIKGKKRLLWILWIVKSHYPQYPQPNNKSFSVRPTRVLRGELN